MRSDELITAALRAPFIPTTHPEYTSAVVLQELNRTFPNVFADPITKVRAGYWLKTYTQLTVAADARYRIPPRALLGGLERVELADSSGNFQELDEATPAEIGAAAGNSSTNAAQPQLYYVEGDQVVLLPQPSVSGLSLRMSYYVAPSRLVTSQSSTLGGDGVVRGLITAWNPSARTITVNVVPFDQELAVPVAITSANQRIDVVHARGWHELALVDATQSLAGSVFTVGGTDSLADIVVNEDFVRVAEQTDWPCLPDEFHQTLADACGSRFAQQLGMLAKAAAMMKKVGISDEKGNYPPGSDLGRFMSLIRTRVKASPKRVTRKTGIIHGGTLPRVRGAVGP